MFPNFLFSSDHCRHGHCMHGCSCSQCVLVADNCAVWWPTWQRDGWIEPRVVHILVTVCTVRLGVTNESLFVCRLLGGGWCVNRLGHTLHQVLWNLESIALESGTHLVFRLPKVWLFRHAPHTFCFGAFSPVISKPVSLEKKMWLFFFSISFHFHFFS